MKHNRFFAALFDLSFSEFITTKLIKLIYAISLVVSGVVIVAGVVTAFTRSAVVGIVALVLAPIAFLLSALSARVWTELLIVIFRIAENTGEIAKASKAE